MCFPVRWHWSVTDYRNFIFTSHNCGTISSSLLPFFKNVFSVKAEQRLQSCLSCFGCVVFESVNDQFFSIKT